jgi:hypothetical protein
MLGYHHGQKYGNTTLPTTFIERLKEKIVTENVSFDFMHNRFVGGSYDVVFFAGMHKSRFCWQPMSGHDSCRYAGDVRWANHCQISGLLFELEWEEAVKIIRTVVT